MLARLHPSADPAQDDLTIHAQLEGDDRAMACGYTVRSSSPVLALCRDLVEAGAFPHTPLIAFRGDTPCLFVRSIGEAAALEVNGQGTGFIPAPKRRIAPPMRAIASEGHFPIAGSPNA